MWQHHNPAGADQTALSSDHDVLTDGIEIIRIDAGPAEETGVPQGLTGGQVGGILRQPDAQTPLVK